VAYKPSPKYDTYIRRKLRALDLQVVILFRKLLWSKMKEIRQKLRIKVIFFEGLWGGHFYFQRSSYHLLSFYPQLGGNSFSFKISLNKDLEKEEF